MELGPGLIRHELVYMINVEQVHVRDPAQVHRAKMISIISVKT